MSLYVSLKKAGHMLGVHSSTVKRWAEGGHFKMIRSVGGHRKVSLVDVENMVRRNTQYATRPNPTLAPAPVGEPVSVVDFVEQQQADNAAESQGYSAGPTGTKPQERAAQEVSDPLGLDDL